ncbi:hypothetical protein [Streptomyces sp. NPDC003023]|uniref:hypothetical protein n=1 Tax=Streptomyces sp. NPDC003023 TaxID=3364675 RepID=UPI0036B9C904
MTNEADLEKAMLPSPQEPAAARQPDRPDEDCDLAEVLRNGPFALALRLAIRSRGLTLDRIHHRLRLRDCPVSVTALSNWQSGRNQPERPESLRALTELEAILALPVGSLAALVGPPRPRGRWLNRPPGTRTPEDVWEDMAALGRVLGSIGASVRDFDVYTDVVVHQTAHVNANRLRTGVSQRKTIRAERSGVSRLIVVCREAGVSQPPKIVRTRYCRLGRTGFDTGSGYVAFELLLDRALPAGQYASYAYELLFPAGSESSFADVRVTSRLQELAHEVTFAPLAVPRHCCRFHLDTVTSPHEDVSEIWLGPSATAQTVMMDPAPGVYGIRWEWQ